jgi:hypothetical protein
VDIIQPALHKLRHELLCGIFTTQLPTENALLRDTLPWHFHFFIDHVSGIDFSNLMALAWKNPGIKPFVFKMIMALGGLREWDKKSLEIPSEVRVEMRA